MITSGTSTPVPNLVALPLAGASLHIGYVKYYAVVPFLCCFVLVFFSGTCPGQTPNGFSRLMTQTTRFHPRMCLFGVRIMRVKHIFAHFGLPYVRPWDNRGNFYMNGKRIQWSNASQHVHIYFQPFLRYSDISVASREVNRSKCFITFYHILLSSGYVSLGQLR